MKKLIFLMMLLGLIFISAGDVMAVGDEQVLIYKDSLFQGHMSTYNGAFSADVMDDGWNDNIDSIKSRKKT